VNTKVLDFVIIKNPIIFFIILTCIVFIDTSLVKILTPFSISLKGGFIYNIYSIIVFFSILITFILLINLNISVFRDKKIILPNIRGYNLLLTIIQSTIILINFFILLQITVIQENVNYVFIIIIIYLSYLTNLFFSILLIIKFYKWYKYEKEVIVLGHAIAITILSIFIFTSVLYISFDVLKLTHDFQKPFNLNSSIIGQKIYSNPFSEYHNILYILSFIAVWTVTIFLLHYHFNKIHKIYFIIIYVSLLVYFLIRFMPYGLDYIQTIILIQPHLYGKIYILLFSGTGPLGGILFGLALLLFARKTGDPLIKKYLSMAAFGMVLFFTINQQQPLGGRFSLLPFGLISLSLTGFSTYLIFIGIYSTVIYISTRKTLANTILKKISGEKFFRNIAKSELESNINSLFNQQYFKTEIEKRIFSAVDSTTTKELVDDVIRNLKKIKSEKD
jgi:hypothetical protein